MDSKEDKYSNPGHFAKGDRVQLISPYGWQSIQCPFGGVRVPSQWWGTVVIGDTQLITVYAPTILWDAPFDCAPVMVPVHWIQRDE